MTILVSAFTCAVAAALCPFVLRPILHRAGVLDVPNARSAHATPTLRGMGIAALIGMLVGALFAPASLPLWLMVGVSVVMATIGLVDDLRSLSARVRFTVQFAIGLVVGFAVVMLFGLTWWAVPASAVVFAGFVNMANFMDGANGVSALFGAVAGAAFAIIGVLTEREWLLIAGVLIGVAFLMFLPWNVVGAGMFLGDCGSYLLGSSVAVTSILAMASGVPWPAALAPLAVYVTDTVTTIAIRLVRGERWWEAHRQHQYQQLIDSGWSHIRTAFWLATFIAIAAAGGMIALQDVPSSVLIAAGAVILVCAAYLLTARFLINGRRRTHA